MVAIIDTDDKIEPFLPILEIVREGVIAISDVEVIRYGHRSDQRGGRVVPTCRRPGGAVELTNCYGLLDAMRCTFPSLYHDRASSW
jgi:hypothetical protein